MRERKTRKQNISESDKVSDFVFIPLNSGKRAVYPEQILLNRLIDLLILETSVVPCLLWLKALYNDRIKKKLQHTRQSLQTQDNSRPRNICIKKSNISCKRFSAPAYTNNQPSQQLLVVWCVLFNLGFYHASQFI